MLTELTIRNIVLIEQCDIAFTRGLCVLTGETGAGKSILLDALTLALGARSETRLIRQGKEQASVSATFDVGGNETIKMLLEQLGLEPTDELLIRRTVTADGKTKCFINDSAVSVSALKSIGDRLIEINGQHDGRGLLDISTHREMLDLYGELQPIVAEVSALYKSWAQNKEKLAQTQASMEAAEREKDYILHMQKELSALAPQPNEDAELAEKRTIMMQSEKLSGLLNDVITELRGGKGIVGQLNSAQRILSRSTLSTHFGSVIDLLERASNDVGEAEASLEKILHDSEYDQNKLEQIEERLFTLRAVARKYNVTSEQLPGLLSEINDKLSDIKNQERDLVSLQKAVSEAKEKYRITAEKLSKQRKKAASQLEHAVMGELESLKMNATKFSVLFETQSEERWSAAGLDSIQFQAATNKGTSLAPLHKIASGGELSRFMLAMKVALAKVKSTPSIIFDEIDTGTGGAVADAIGKRLVKLGKTHQVLVVTHLPQVAAMGNHHLRILKEEKSSQTFTKVETLTDKGRKEELARMLAGAEVTLEARKAAEKLLQAAR